MGTILLGVVKIKTVQDLAVELQRQREVLQEIRTVSIELMTAKSIQTSSSGVSLELLDKQLNFVAQKLVDSLAFTR